MNKELEILMKNAYTPYDTMKFTCIVKMDDGTCFRGVTVKNSVFRDGIYAEQIAIARAVSAGYKKGDFDSLYLMVNTNDIGDLRYLNRDIIVEFFDPSDRVVLFTIDGEKRVLKVGNLFSNIY